MSAKFPRYLIHHRRNLKDDWLSQFMTVTMAQIQYKFGLRNEREGIKFEDTFRFGHFVLLDPEGRVRLLTECDEYDIIEGKLHGPDDHQRHERQERQERRKSA